MNKDDIKNAETPKKGHAADTRHVQDRSYAKGSDDRNIRMKAQEIRDVQPGQLPPRTSNKHATSFVDVTELTPTGDFGSRCDNDGGKAGICGHEEPEGTVMHDHVQALREKREKELEAAASKAKLDSLERKMGFTDDSTFLK